VPERDARRDHVRRRPQRQAVAADEPDADDECRDQAAIKYAAGPHE